MQLIKRKELSSKSKVGFSENANGKIGAKAITIPDNRSETVLRKKQADAMFNCTLGNKIVGVGSNNTVQRMKVTENRTHEGHEICEFTLYEEHPNDEGNYKDDGYHYTFLNEKNWRVYYSRIASDEKSGTSNTNGESGLSSSEEESEAPSSVSTSSVLRRKPKKKKRLTLRDKLMASDRVNKTKSGGDDLKKKLIKLFAAGKITLRSIDKKDAENLLEGKGLLAPGGDRDIEKHVTGESSGSTAYISVSEMPTNRFRSGGVGQAVVVHSLGENYIPKAEVEEAVQSNPTAVEYAGRAYEGLYRGNVPQELVRLIPDEINKEEIDALRQGAEAQKIGKNGWKAYQKAMAEYKEKVKKSRERRGKFEK